ncbi:MAG: LemA family protein [Candidatus Bilamarchaeaceae archaeon]
MRNFMFDICFCFLFVILLFFFYIFSIYNSLIELRNQIYKSWANVDVLLKKRADLIPNLVEVVQSYAKHEKTILNELTALRSQLINVQSIPKKAQINKRLDNLLHLLFIVSENYPKLRASENFSKLHDELVLLENQIADRREFYNNSVYLFNTRIHSFPDLIIAKLLGMKDFEYFKVEEEKQNVDINAD